MSDIKDDRGLPETDTDICLPFLIGNGAFRGRLVRLTSAVTDILRRHRDPPEVSVLLAEAMVAAVALASGLKYSGVFTLQIQGKGPVHTLVTDVTSGGDLRGCAKFDAEGLQAELSKPRASGSTPRLLGSEGHLVFTVDQGPETERYQGVVALTGGTIADSIHTYFRQSEQIESVLKMAVSVPAGSGPCTAAAFLVQRMPEEGGRPLNAEEAEEDWRTAVILLGSVKDSELLDLSVPAERLLARIYATMGVRLLDRRPVAARCRCSRDRSERILASFPVEELKTYAEDGQLHMTCEFCGTDYVFSDSELAALAEKYRTRPDRGDRS